MASPTRPAQRLPPEILDLILPVQPPSLDFALSPADPLATTLPETLAYYASLRSAALVCRSWYHGTAPHLWRNVTIWRDGQIASILKAPSASARLPDTRHLRVLWDRQPAIPSDPELMLLPELLRRCLLGDEPASLRYLTLAGDQFEFAHSCRLTSVLKPLAPSLKGLSVCSFGTWGHSNPRQSPVGPFGSVRFGPQGNRTGSVMGSFLQSLDSLDEVRFDEFRSAHNSLLGTFACRPRRVMLQKCVLESANMVRLLKPLAGCLRDLALHRTSLGTHETFSQMIHSLGQGGLESLEIKECDLWATWVDPSPSLFTTILASCPALHSLTFSGTLDTAIDDGVVPRHDSLMFLSLGSMGVPASMVALGLCECSWPCLDMLEATRGGRWKPRELARIEVLCQELDITFFVR